MTRIAIRTDCEITLAQRHASENRRMVGNRKLSKCARLLRAEQPQDRAASQINRWRTNHPETVAEARCPRCHSRPRA